jgi:hypothetical protein
VRMHFAHTHSRTRNTAMFGMSLVRRAGETHDRNESIAFGACDVLCVSVSTTLSTGANFYLRSWSTRAFVHCADVTDGHECDDW